VDYEGVALEVWKYQYDANPLYRTYCDLLDRVPGKVISLDQIPFLPITMFREHDIQCGDWIPEQIFRSSGTTGQHRSRHLVRSLAFYHEIAARNFRQLMGPPEGYFWIGLLPSYLERNDSSLVDMVHYFMQCSGQDELAFYPKVDEAVIDLLKKLSIENRKVALVGVSFALLDLFERRDVPVWDQLVVIETGGMKGRGKELTRTELYNTFRSGYPTLKLCSEYGMTELMSQAYLMEDRFVPGPLMQVLIRDISDPLSMVAYGQRGGMNVIDLGNLDTCAFIATDDVGISGPDGRFDVLGRLDDAEIRGCNLMYT
jgi:hypothetical protein